LTAEKRGGEEQRGTFDRKGEGRWNPVVCVECPAERESPLAAVNVEQYPHVIPWRSVSRKGVSMRTLASWTILALGVVLFSVGFSGAVFAGTDSTCYMKAQKNVGGNWVAPSGPSGSVTCNTTVCPPGMGDEICQGREHGASSLYPSYNVVVCACGDSGYSVRCELLYYYNPENPGDFFYACPLSLVCQDVPGTDCELEETETATWWRCRCK
jgi:hypothetical protein